MSAAATRQQVPEFLREVFDRNLPELRNRLATLEKHLEELLSGRQELVPDCIKAAHDLTGSLGVFGLSAASDSASQIEMMLRRVRLGGGIDSTFIHSEISNLRDTLHP